MLKIISKDGYDYKFDPNACKDCGGKCCIGEQGYIWVTKLEINEIAKLLNLSVEVFVSDYLKKIKYKYSIKEALVDGSWECIFFDKQKGCQIYDKRPSQCKSYPFWDYVKQNIDKERENCPGII